MILQQLIERLYDLPAEKINHDDALEAIGQLVSSLNRGEVRAAEMSSGTWHVNAWVKKGILLAFRVGRLTEFPASGGFQFFDKETMTLKKFGLNDNVRIVPGGSAIRDGAYVAPGVVMMPPSYINIGAYVDGGTLIDSHALIGSCAQIGKRVHLSAAAQIGGVLEPIGSMPVIIEDDVFVGGNSGIYEGTIVKRRAVVGAGVILTGSTPVYDIVRQTIYKKSEGQSLTIPENAVVIPGNRHIHHPFAKEHHLSIYAPVIVKYRDEKTDAATVLEESLR
ncbi:MAG: 2,3,4,5-tetrahydropyridine-2,6-dicarboxylate N-succinyltransferase [Ignavibacteriae bacterium]|nr:2,3,4,5-tetrahydropyridine-2,6-dicarboxylate N-succinyltransferase [Ignavibacteria bacterium]MBI3364139.1 2,3,4,5-tetrahydropyridine-2,6-dicarboxylate N-succinyltransferase [Ignavibacteriota bacterium]